MAPAGNLVAAPDVVVSGDFARAVMPMSVEAAVAES
jgi:hypothetical protein